jgi:putative heme transporter
LAGPTRDGDAADPDKPDVAAPTSDIADVGRPPAETAPPEAEPPDAEPLEAGSPTADPPDAALAEAELDERRDPLGHQAVPRGVQVAAAWSWRLVVIAGAIGVGLYIIARLQLVVVPLTVALLLSALLQPLAAALVRRGFRRALAAAVVMVGGLGAIGLLVWLVVHEFRNGYGDLVNQIQGGVDKIRDWLINGPLGMSASQLDRAIDSAKNSLSENRAALTSGAVGAATTAGHVFAGLLLTLFATFFFLKDGRQIFGWATRLFPRAAQPRVAGAGDRAWRTLISYVRATILVAFIDATGIGLGAALLGVPLALPLAVIVFLGSFVPIIGATVSGLIAVLVALVAKGPVVALLLLAIVLLVQQLEGHVLQPLLLGRAVQVHPLAVVFGIAAGVLLAGIVGALIAVPLIAVANTVAKYLSGGDRTAATVAQEA